MRMTWLADRLRDAGLTVVEHDGWETRGRHMTRHNGTMVHHTGSANDKSPATEARILRDGHSRLAGPLAHLGLRRDGIFDVIAAGRCHHAGTGSWPGLDGNDDCIGIELYGRSSWPQRQLDALVAGCAVLQGYTGLPASTVIAHREWAPDRKVDPAEIDMDRLRRDVETKMGDDMPLSDDDAVKVAKAVWAARLPYADGKPTAIVGLDRTYRTVQIVRASVADLQGRDGNVDVDSLAEAIAAELDDDLAAAVLDALRARLAE